MKFDLNEIIYTIQGESSYAGFPCVLVRFCGCNLKCVYCDTEHTEVNKRLTLNELFLEVDKFGCHMVEFTGGEPLLQNNLKSAVDMFLDKNYKVLIETNGSKDLSVLAKSVVFIVDVKSPASGAGDSFRLENLKYLTADDELKFVLTDRNDYLWARKFIKKHLLLKKYKLIFACASSFLNIKDLAQWMLEDKLNDIRLQTQLHKFIWGVDAKGV